MTRLYSTDGYPPLGSVPAAQAVVIAIERTSSLESGELETLKKELDTCKSLLGLIVEKLPPEHILEILNQVGYKWRET